MSAVPAADAPLTLFDLDNTLLGGDSDHAWGQYLCEIGAVDPAGHAARNERFYADYQAGTLDIDEFLAFQLEPLARHPRNRLETWRETFVRERIEPMLLPRALDLIETHRRRGHHLAIITATNRFITEPIALRLGIDHLLATEPELIDGEYTGQHQGTPCFQNGKVTVLQAWLEAMDLHPTATWFYSDSINDVPLLEWADHAIVVDPDPRLAELAATRGWPQISLRS